MGYSDILDSIWTEPIVQYEGGSIDRLLIAIVISKLH